MKKLIVAIVCFTALALPFKSSGQAFLTLDPPTGTGWINDTVLASSTVTFPVLVRNAGTQPFFGTIVIHIEVEDSFGTFIPTQIDSFEVQVGNMLMPQDTVTTVISHVIDMNRYQAEGNTIVIWPEADDIDTDSLYGDVWVLDPNSLIEYTQEHELIPVKFYPNPAQDFVNVELPALTGVEVEQVRIVSISGQVMREVNNTGRVPLEGMAPGIYFLELWFNNGAVQSYKIIKQH